MFRKSYSNRYTYFINLLIYMLIQTFYVLHNIIIYFCLYSRLFKKVDIFEKHCFISTVYYFLYEAIVNPQNKYVYS